MSDEADQAARTTELLRADGIARAQAAVTGAGRFVCDCGAEISPARRTAHPSAKDCIDCATFRERQARRRRA